ncbi:MAG: SOS response-associated peptidase [Cyanobacteria bacterium J06634_6]
MCGRYTQTQSGEAIAAAFHLAHTPDPTPRYNIAPTQPVSAIAQPGTERQYRIFQWGLIPSWAKDPAIGNRMINARAETAAEKPSFRTAFKRRRCLIVADGFYEWKKVAPSATGNITETQGSEETSAKGKAKAKKQPYYIQMNDPSLFAMAGLWESWESGDGSYIESCTILTTEPNGLMQSIHNRMPVILHPADYDLWLDPKEQSRERLQPLLRPYEDDAMQAYPVSTAVNNPRNETAACVEPAA